MEGLLFVGIAVFVLVGMIITFCMAYLVLKMGRALHGSTPWHLLQPQPPPPAPPKDRPRT